MIPAYDIVAVNVYFGQIIYRIPLLLPGYPMVGIDDLDIGIAEIPLVSVDKYVISARHGKIFNPIAGKDIDLHSVIRYEKMVSPAHNGMGGVIEQIVCIKGQYVLRRQVIVKKFLMQVDRGLDIQAVILIVGENHPFGKGQDRVFGRIVSGHKGDRAVEQGECLAVCQMGFLGILKTAQADMLSLVGDRRTVIQSTVFSAGRKDAG